MALTKVSAGVLNIDDLYGFRNRIINGAMEIDQRYVGTSINITNDTNFYTVDRWQIVESSSCALSSQQVTDAPAGFLNSLRITVGTAAGSIGASETGFALQRIEGNNVADLNWGTANAKTVTLSFWVKSSVTGSFSGSLKNAASNRSYPFSYTINSVNTWEYKTITIPGDTSGTWNTSTGVGVGLTFDFGSGSSRRGPANTWASANYDGVSSSASIVTTLNATWQLTGVQFEVGSVATPFERRPYNTEFDLCQRYYQKSFPQSMAPGTANFQGTIRLHAAGGGGAGVDAYSGWHVSFTGGKMRPGVSVTTYSSAAAGQVTYLRDNGSTVNGSHGGSVGVEHGFNLFGSYAGSGSVSTTRSLYFDYIADAEL